jgi:hypothetical protein
MTTPAQQQLTRFLDDLAADAVPADRDLWPEIERRLREPSVRAPHAQPPVARIAGHDTPAAEPASFAEPGPVREQNRHWSRQWLELAAGIVAIVLAGVLLVGVFGTLPGNERDHGNGPSESGTVDAGRLYVVSQVFGAEEGVEVTVGGRVTAYDAASGVELYAIQTGSQVDAVLSPSGAFLYVSSISTSASGDDLIAFDARTGQELWRRVIHDRVHFLLQLGPSTLAASPDGQRLYIYSSSAPGQAWLQVLDTESRALLGRFDVPYCAADLHISPNGQTLYTLCHGGGMTGLSAAIDLATQEPLRMDPVLPSDVSATSLSPDGRLLYAVSRAKVTIIDLDARTIIEQVPLSADLHPARLLQLVSLSSDGRYLFVGIDSEALPENDGPASNVVAVYDTDTWQEVTRIAADLPITAQTLAAAPGGRAVFAANNSFREGTSIATQSTILTLSIDAAPVVFSERSREEIIRMFTYTGATDTQPDVTVTPSPTPTPGADDCTVTPTGSAPPDLSQAAFTDTWYSGNGLWAGLGPELEGIWGEGHNRVLWWRQNPQPLAVTGRRLDGDAPPLEVRIFDGYAGMSHQITSVIVPTPGCWQVTATSGDQHLTLTLDVVPYGETAPGRRDQELNARYAALREEQTPYPIPDTCPVTTWIGPETLGIGIPDARYRIDGDGLTLGQDVGLLFDGVANAVYWIAGSDISMDDALRGAIQVDARHALDPYVRVRSEVGEQIGYRSVEGGMSRSWFGKLTFPTPGCWTLQATIGPYVLDAVVYVYPQRARSGVVAPNPELNTPTPATSERPANPDIPWLTPEQEAEASARALDDPDVTALIAGISGVYVEEVGLMHEGREQIGGAVVLRWEAPVTLAGAWLVARWDCVAEDSDLPYTILRHHATYSNVTALIVHVDLRYGKVFGISTWPDAVAETIEWPPPGNAECDGGEP